MDGSTTLGTDQRDTSCCFDDPLERWLLSFLILTAEVHSLQHRTFLQDPVTGLVDPDAARAAKEEYEQDVESMRRPVEYDM